MNRYPRTCRNGHAVAGPSDEHVGGTTPGCLACWNAARRRVYANLSERKMAEHMARRRHYNRRAADRRDAEMLSTLTER